jgi:D-amino-acid dehydrogenase
MTAASVPPAPPRPSSSAAARSVRRAAYALAEAGHEVVLLERGAVGRGASAGHRVPADPEPQRADGEPGRAPRGAAVPARPAGPFSLRPTPRLLPWLARFTFAALQGAAVVEEGTVLLRRMAQESLALHRAWHDRLDTGLVRRGLVNAYLTGPGLLARDALVAAHRALGMAAEVLDADGVRDLEPAVRGARGGAFHPDEAHLDSLVFVQRVAAGARGAGAVVCEDVEVLRIARDRGQLTVTTTAGTIRAERLVLATGVAVGRFARDLGVRLPVQPAKGYHVEHRIEPPPLTRPVFLAETRVVATPLTGRLRLAGTLELGTDPEAVDHRRVAAVAAAGRRHVAGLEAAPVTDCGGAATDVGRRPADRRPRAGRRPRADRRRARDARHHPRPAHAAALVAARPR